MFKNLEKNYFNLFIILFLISSLTAFITNDIHGMVFPVLWGGFGYFIVYFLGVLEEDEQ